MTIPTLNQLYLAIIADLESNLSITIPLIGKSYLRAKAMVMAGRLYLLYLLIAQVQKNIFVDTCDEETLARFGQVKLNRDRYPATQGQYTVLCVGTIGETIPGSTQFKANDDSQSPGKLFVVDADYVLDGVNIFTLRALEGGTDSQLAIGDKLSLTGPIPLIDTEVTVQTESVQPQEAETIEDYRQKVINAYRYEPQGGAAADYRLWSTEVQGIVQAYPYATNGQVSEVDLFIESDEPDGVPSAADLANVESSIEDPTSERPSRKPITHIVNYLSITPLDVDITITDYEDYTAAKDALIEAAITDALADIRPFVSAIDVLADKNDYFDTNTIVSIILAAVPGSVFGAVTMTVGGTPYTSFIFSNGDIPKLNNITYA